ncbi:MAG TPA: DUF899 domain-containing protein [Nevskiaceae bacterium]|nr:DUF899 domain-containing protein [Nevskiaceae bacterium]
MKNQPAVTQQQWLKARRALLAKEKKFTRLRDELARQRQALPWVRVEKDYVFEGAKGRRTLAQLFDGRSQLVIYHFMFGPDWNAGCPHCSHWADSFDRAPVHLAQRDVSFAAVSRAPYKKLAAYRKRMGWNFSWLSSAGSDFNFDFGASFTPQQLAEKKKVYNFGTLAPGVSEREGVSVFCRDKRGRIFHTYSTFARGIDALSVDYQILDLTPKGRDEDGRGPYWVRRHDEYAS